MNPIDAVLFLTGRLKYGRRKKMDGRTLRSGDEIVKEADLSVLFIVGHNTLQYPEHNSIRLICMCTVEFRPLQPIGGKQTNSLHDLLF